MKDSCCKVVLFPEKSKNLSHSTISIFALTLSNGTLTSNINSAVIIIVTYDGDDVAKQLVDFARFIAVK